MGSERRKQLILGALVVALLVTAYRNWPGAAPARTAATNQGRTAGRSKGRAAATTLTAPDVRLEALSAERAKPEEADRNLFRFKPKAPPPPPPAPPKPIQVEKPAATGPPPPPPPAPITLKFIGIIDRGGQKIAVLSDSAGHVDYGAEGAIIGGRYRVLKIGVESIEMAQLDGRGRQTIRLTGS